MLTTTVPALPATARPAGRLNNTDLTHELAQLRAWAWQHLGNAAAVQAASYMGRVAELAQEQELRARTADLAARLQRERERTAAFEARAQIGPPSRASNGTLVYPVSCAEHGQLGTVQRPYARARTWKFVRADNGASGQECSTRREAAGVLVWLADLAAAAEQRQYRQDSARHTVPAGWEYGDWNELSVLDVIRSPRYGTAEDGSLYPRGWSDAAVVQAVTLIGRARTVVALTRPDGSYTDPLLISDQRMKDVGFLWPVGRTRPQIHPRREELRIRMADIGDDVATVRRPLGDTPRVRDLADLIARVERGDTRDLFADLRLIEDETGFLASQVSDRDQPFEIREIGSWAAAAYIKARQARAAFTADLDRTTTAPAVT
ncbi:hypothetical protein [Streptomyces goshikiensis]|uniref:hypothetical protein n=1 Tax=Streptomyces goshikiensis TaxID=1942 RepID=UPI00368DD9CC